MVKKFTHDFISSCIPTFKWFLNKYPLTLVFYYKQLELNDIENYKLSKKVQAKLMLKLQQKLKLKEKLKKNV